LLSKVPTRFNYETFAAAGVNRSKLVVIPEPVDTDYFDPDRVESLYQNDHSVFRFLSIFKWEKRKNYDLLLNAFFDEFDATDNVTLYIVTQPYHGELKAAEYVKMVASNFNKTVPKVHVIHHHIPSTMLPSLYKSMDALGMYEKNVL
jgi:glycosyltransferase involved in cell wall biosynthesis